MAKAKEAIPEGHYTITPIVTYDKCADAIEWYKKGLGAQEISRFLTPDGTVGHAEIQIGSSRIMMHDAMMGGKGPSEYGGSPMNLWIYVEDCDSLFNRAIEAGATPKQPVMDQFWGDRCGTITDPHGYSWTIATHIEDLTEAEMGQRAQEFFAKMAQQPQARAAGAGA